MFNRRRETEIFWYDGEALPITDNEVELLTIQHENKCRLSTLVEIPSADKAYVYAMAKTVGG